MSREADEVLPQHVQDLPATQQRRKVIDSHPSISTPPHSERPARSSKPSHTHKCYQSLSRILGLGIHTLIVIAGVTIGAIALGRVLQVQYFREGSGSEYSSSTIMKVSAPTSLSAWMTSPRSETGIGVVVKSVVAVVTQIEVAEYPTADKVRILTTTADS